MIKEELEKEAEEWVISNTEIYDDKFGLECEEAPNPKEAYLAGALPREKRIEELEKENETATRKANEAISDKLLITAKYNEILNDLNQQNDKLQKENSELKERNKELLESCEGATMMYKDLCKAKEIIRYLLSFIQKENYKTRWDINIAEAEQFLKE